MNWLTLQNSIWLCVAGGTFLFVVLVAVTFIGTCVAAAAWKEHDGRD